MLGNYFRLAIQGIIHRKLRSWLTMVGIFIGIAAVVALISLGEGLQAGVEQQFENLGKDKIVVSPQTIGPPGSATSESLLMTSEDQEIVEKVRGVEWVVGYLIKTGQAVFRDEAGIGFGVGLDVDGLEKNEQMQGLEIIEGRRLKDDDKYKVVIGYNHAQDGEIWDKGMKIGDKVEIEGVEFKVVGIYSKVGNPFDDGYLYMPKESLKEVVDSGDEVSQMVAKVSKNFDIDLVAEQIEDDLRDFRGEEEGQETFDVQTSEQLLESFSEVLAVVQGILVGIAAISLLVGGVGISNTMYTSVLERTRDIGIMKSIGARNENILTLFLIESGLLGMVGGAIGVLIGVGLGKIAEIAISQAIGTDLIKAGFSVELIVGALLFSFVVGAVSGVLPARQASKLRPVDALRYE